MASIFLFMVIDCDTLRRRFTPLSSKGRDEAEPRIRFLQINDKVKILAETLSPALRLCVNTYVYLRLKTVLNQSIGPVPARSGKRKKKIQICLREPAC
jgi:hypothetical protein